MPAPELKDLGGSIPNSRSQPLLQIRKELTIMLRKALTLGMVFIFTLSLLAVSMITCFTYDAAAMAPPDDFGVVHEHDDHGHFKCKVDDVWHDHLHAQRGVDCSWWTE